MYNLDKKNLFKLLIGACFWVILESVMVFFLFKLLFLDNVHCFFLYLNCIACFILFLVRLIFQNILTKCFQKVVGTKSVISKSGGNMSPASPV